MQQDVVQTLKYFSLFDYSPTFEEILVFLTRKTNPQNLQKSIKTLIKGNRLSEKDNRYTLGEYIKTARNLKKRVQISEAKIQKLRPFLKLISLFPQVKLVGLSGSVAMLNAKHSDDIDLFVITGKNRLWTGRFICLMIASLFGRRKFNDRHTSNKICLNLFFDEGNLQINPKKRSIYVAHEVLQMKPLIDRGNAYRSFLEANKWVFKLFPNAKLMFSNTSLKNASNSFSSVRRKTWQPRMPFFKSAFFEHFQDRIESILKRVQLLLINRHRTTEKITDTQLWFFPDDFEKKMKE